MIKQVLVFTLVVIQMMLNGCEKIEYYDCKNNDEYFAFIENNNKECIENITSNIVENIDASPVMKIYSIKDYLNSESNNFMIVLLGKSIGKYTGDSIFGIQYLKNNILFTARNRLTDYKNNTFIVSITKVDEEEGIITGEFSGKLYDVIHEDSIIIKNGVFKSKIVKN
ncbi:MAG TPA: hypothetical protein PK199_02855 [Bacteroidales bacterium]|nr:hypothetical protein [Bacteroidales bacterium]